MQSVVAEVLPLPSPHTQHQQLPNQTPAPADYRILSARNPVSAPVVHLGWQLLAVLVIALK
jgi:hypothetical protein